ncbi:unnamed protein product [Effrenium voratum]|nr:unnamed protein product [Effrenium voratum]
MMDSTHSAPMGTLPEDHVAPRSHLQALPETGTLEAIQTLPQSQPRFQEGQTLEVWSESKKAWLPGVVLAAYSSDTSAEGYQVPAGTVKAPSSVKALPPMLGRSASKPLADEADRTKVRAVTPALAKTSGISGRLARSENNLTRLASTLQARSHVMEAAKSQPQLLWEQARLGEQALPALARVLKSERLAVKATKMRPELLRYTESQIRKIMPTLVSLCGGAQEAAYAISARPELLEIEGAHVLRDSLQAVSSFFGNLKDALYMLGQTTAPPSLRVVARQFCREFMVGQYFLVEGAQVDDRPVWRKPAVAMRHLGSKATDVYLIYCQKGVVGSDTMKPCWTFTTNYTPALKKYDYCDPSILGWAETSVKSPDQTEPGDWHFPEEKHKTQVPGLWPADRYVACQGHQGAWGPWLCATDSMEMRRGFDHLRMALGLAWLQPEAESEGAARGPCLLGHLVKNDPVFQGSKTLSFLDLADFAHIRRWQFLQLPADTSTGKLKMIAWEPIEVCMLFLAEDAESERDLQRADFRIMPEGAAKSLPKLKGAEVQPSVWARTFQSGPFELPVPAGKTPPLVFIHSKISAHVQGTRPCQMAKLQAGEEVYLPEPEEDAPEALDVTLLPKPKPVMFQLVSPGELGYTGYSLFKGPPCAQLCEQSEVQMRIESMERLSVAMLLFPRPSEGLEAEPLAPPPGNAASRANSKTGSKNPAASNPSSAPRSVQVSKVECAEPPCWIREDGWAVQPQKVATSVQTEAGLKVTCTHLYTNTLEPGNALEVPGCGASFFCLFLFKQLSPERPDTLRQLLLREPALLTKDRQVDSLVRQLRQDLGDSLARAALTQKLDEWPKLCQTATDSELARWVYDQKVAALGQEVGCAREILGRLGERPVAAPLLLDRCQALRKICESRSLDQVLQELPELLTVESNSLLGSFETLQSHLGQSDALASAEAHLRLLMLQDQLGHFFSILLETFSGADLRELHDKATREWVKWPSIVERSDHEIHSWRGRLAALFRHGKSAARVQNFGAAPYGTAALAQAAGEIPEIPPLLV